MCGRRGVAGARAPVPFLLSQIGCGGNVPTVRCTTENFVSRIRRAGAVATLVRVNPELPLADRIRDDGRGDAGADGDDAADDDDEENVPTVLSVMSKGLAAIQRIDAALPAAFKEGSTNGDGTNRAGAGFGGNGRKADALPHGVKPKKKKKMMRG